MSNLKKVKIWQKYYKTDKVSSYFNSGPLLRDYRISLNSLSESNFSKDE